MTLLLQASGREGGRMILSGMLTDPRVEGRAGGFRQVASDKEPE
jgi:hypothetical protein